MWALLLTSAIVFSASDSPPPLLRGLLASHAELGLLDPRLDLTGPQDYKTEDLKGFGYWPPWVVEDFDGDGKQDVAAVVVRRDKSPFQFGLVAVHARNSARLYWIRPLGEQVLLGVARGLLRATVVPLHCIECDSNEWYRWSGGSYQLELYEAGEEIAVATSDGTGTVGVLESPSRGSRMLHEVAQCITAKVVRSKGRAFDMRWYLIDIKGGGGFRGWVPASWVVEQSCMG